MCVHTCQQTLWSAWGSACWLKGPQGRSVRKQGQRDYVCASHLTFWPGCPKPRIWNPLKVFNFLSCQISVHFCSIKLEWRWFTWFWDSTQIVALLLWCATVTSAILDIGQTFHTDTEGWTLFLSAGTLPPGCLSIRGCLVTQYLLTACLVILGCWSQFPPPVPPRGVVMIKVMFFKYRDIPD